MNPSRSTADRTKGSDTQVQDLPKDPQPPGAKHSSAADGADELNMDELEETSGAGVGPSSDVWLSFSTI